MSRWLWILPLLLGSALGAQERADTGASTPPAPLLQEFRRRWQQHVRERLELTPDQGAKLQATEDRFAAQRRPIAQSQRQIQLALRGQLEPGGAANADSVNHLIAARDRNRAALFQLEQEEDHEMSGYLSPVQRARYQMMRQQLQERIAEMRRQRRGPMFGPRRGRLPPGPP